MDMHGHQSKDSLTKFASNLHQHKRFDWAVRNFKSVVMQLVQDFPVSSVCEIGGGRSPTLQPDDARRLNIDIMINDILSEELKLLPGEFKTSCFDVSNRNLPESQIEKYDLVFSCYAS